MFIDVISTGSNTLLLVKGQTGKGCCLLFCQKKVWLVFVHFMGMLKVSYVGMDWDVRDVSIKGWQKASKPNCILLMNNSLVLTSASVPQWVFLSLSLSFSSIISLAWTCASVPQGVFLSSATS